jgi:hypothetical protein
MSTPSICGGGLLLHVCQNVRIDVGGRRQIVSGEVLTELPSDQRSRGFESHSLRKRCRCDKIIPGHTLPPLGWHAP